MKNSSKHKRWLAGGSAGVLGFGLVLAAQSSRPGLAQSATAGTMDESLIVKGAPRKLDGTLAPNPGQVVAPARIAKPLKIAIYDGNGSGDDGIDNVCQRATMLKGATINRLSPEEIATTDLSRFDVLVFSGGSGSKQGEAIGEKGRQNVRQYIHEGGSYLGICAGAYLACSNYPWSLSILNAKTVSRKWQRGRAFLQLELTGQGKEIFGPVEQKFWIRYNNGPVIEPARDPDLPAYEVRAYFRNEVAENETPKGIMVNSPAVVTANYGKGRVMAISPHGEDTKGLENFIPRALGWLGEK